jgi:hypothetical protein
MTHCGEEANLLPADREWTTQTLYTDFERHLTGPISPARRASFRDSLAAAVDGLLYLWGIT